MTNPGPGFFRGSRAAAFFEMPRPAPPISAGYLAAVTLRYLAQRSTSASHLRRLLMERVRRSPTPAEQAVPLVDAEIARLERLGLLDDARYARSVVRSRHARGTSASGIKAALREKGVAGELVELALEELAEDGGDPQWEAALVWARKRRLGPWSSGEPTPELRAKQLARMGRAGFPYEVARRVLALKEIPD
jgi:regulatory protein